ncbi:MAG: FeoC-like transcriptional regulator [Chloroflexaceae bacterium]|jgi:hypothetical protein|nr:FeoC-like transcriptional regulator [Chloroflexaceae bacterium]
MLHQVLQALEGTQGLISLDELSRQLGVERSALDGMIAYWVRKGRLRELNGTACTSGCGSCGHRAEGGCAFASTAPRTITLVPTVGEGKTYGNA